MEKKFPTDLELPRRSPAATGHLPVARPPPSPTTGRLAKPAKTGRPAIAVAQPPPVARPPPITLSVAPPTLVARPLPVAPPVAPPVARHQSPSCRRSSGRHQSPATGRLAGRPTATNSRPAAAGNCPAG
ncbi:classical arabinogalactan protein 9-like [Nilaparvata lugens]|uniref:classical arabinogalactan protein 9-like n=1 Tax=Nilaparvata lugens TaxID=108931 RepID=UPI00193EA71D|nr:classical arabinogalactan protein 9-like [Nilaparvata lugens]